MQEQLKVQVVVVVAIEVATKSSRKLFMLYQQLLLQHQTLTFLDYPSYHQESSYLPAFPQLWPSLPLFSSPLSRL